MKQRVISAAVALLICIPIILIGGTLFYLGAGLLGIIGFYELYKCKGKNLPISIKAISVVLFCLFMFDSVGNNIIINTNEKILLSILLLMLPIVYYNKSKKYNTEDALFLLGSIIFLGVSFNKLILTRAEDLSIFIYLLLITIMTDTFAYFTGRLIGKNKMCESVSPNKTWEGFIGGLIFGAFISSVFFISVFDYENIFKIILISIILSIIGQIGDLVFSSIKRHFKIKDFGNIMPGHGGVLDRLDSLLFVLIAFSFLSRFL